MSAKRSRRIPLSSPLLFLGGLLWVAAFWLPVFETTDGSISGYWIFVIGWMGFAMFQFAWYANLLIFMGVILMYRSPIRATLLASGGLLIATQAFWFDAFPDSVSSTPIIGHGIGFWLWYASIFILGAGVILGSDEWNTEGPGKRLNDSDLKTEKINSETSIQK